MSCPCGYKQCKITVSIFDKTQWVREHFHQGSGDTMGLNDFATRYKLATDLNEAVDRGEVASEVRDTLHYLLKTKGQ